MWTTLKAMYKQSTTGLTKGIQSRKEKKEGGKKKLPHNNDCKEKTATKKKTKYAN